MSHTHSGHALNRPLSEEKPERASESNLKKPLQPSHVMALKWKPVALSPHTPQIRGALRSNSSGPTTDVVTVMGSITARGEETREEEEEEGRQSLVWTPAGFSHSSVNFAKVKAASCVSVLPVLCGEGSVSLLLKQTGVRLLAYLARASDSHTLNHSASGC